MRKLSTLSGKVKKTPSIQADPNRYDFLDLKNAEPDLGVPPDTGYFLTSDASGNRSWSQQVEVTEIVTTEYINTLAVDANTLNGEIGDYYLDFTNFTNIPDPTVEVNLTGDATGFGSATLTDLANGSITINVTVQDDSHNHTIENVDGLQDALDGKIDVNANTILQQIITVDGAGSGLDADLLDGQEGSYYLDYNNFTNVPDLSSIDADLLDGQDGSYYLDYDNLVNVPDLSGITTDFISSETFTANGTDTEFNLSNPYAFENNIFVSINGVYQNQTAYDLANNTLIFTEAPSNTDVIEVRTFERLVGGVEKEFIELYEFTGDGTRSSFNLSNYIDDDTYAFAYINGIMQRQNEYDVSGYQITFTEVPGNGDEIEVRIFDKTVTTSNTEVDFTSNTDLLIETSSDLINIDPDQVVDQFVAGQERTAKYVVQMTANSDFQASEVLLIHDDTDVYITEYGNINTNGSLGSISADLNSGYVRLLVSPTQANTSVVTKRITVGA